ncbi:MULTISPECIES: hypothetical protein [Streptomyces]|uniref:Uncharacterized protein n=1 Tax=Streptomyces lycii TaxID=2654337 RepID=A0ABQ7F8K1_9ACTN|nr:MULTISPECIES: hypothetical protein [Streptomyces]KAF4405056.1 hypothetical protein GCU69_32430 [Streptomyces lycii]PGH47681.1 hypothetical protein CRI70_27030 [Streptomyces sp. Ru87]
MTRYLSVAAAAGVIAVVLYGATMASDDDPAAGEGAGFRGPSSSESSASAPASPAAGLPAFAYGEKAAERTIDSPRVGICYPFDGPVATAFRNDTDLSAQLYPTADCDGEPGVLVSPGSERAGTAAGRGVVFVVPVEQAGGPED